MNKVTCLDIEIAVSIYFDCRKNIIVPNCYWGAGLHECDMLIINPKTYIATEVEIKISKADLKKDFTKKHTHVVPQIKNLYYAIPEELLETALELVPETAGILLFKPWNPTSSYRIIERHRLAKPNHDFRAMTAKEVINIGRLGCIRIWNLKKVLRNKTEFIKEINDGKRMPDGTLKLSDEIEM